MIEKLTKKELKNIVISAINQERKNENIDIDFFPLGFVELYHHFKNNEKYSLIKIEIIKKDKEHLTINTPPILSTVLYGMFTGFANISNHSAYLLMGHNLIFQKLGIKHQLYSALNTSYHEFYHIYQANLDKHDDYHLAVHKIEHMIQQSSPSFYLDNHDCFLSEIEATKYGITKAEQFIKDNPTLCQNVYEEDKPYINYEKKKNEYDYNNYDLNFMLTKLFKIIEKNPKVIQGTFLKVLYTEDGNLKKIDEILQDQDFLELDPRIQYGITTNNELIKNLNFDYLSTNKLNYIEHALQYQYNLAIQRRSYNNKALREQIASTKEWLKSDCDIANIICNISLLGDRLASQKHTRNINTNMKDISTLTNNINYVEEIKKTR